MTPYVLARLRRTASVLLLSATVALVAACDSADERAEKHFESGMELLEAGDIDRALVEFRNVFKLNGEHREARLAYARAERGRGRLREAYSQYLRLIEQYPDDLEGQRSLAEIAIQSGDLGEAERYVNSAIGIAPEDAGTRAIKIVFDYAKAKQSGDIAAMDTHATSAEQLLTDQPANQLLAGAVIDAALGRQDYDKALTLIDTAIAQTPDDRGLYAMRLSTLSAKGDNAGVEAGLVNMVARFPDDPAMAETLVRWYLSQNQPDKAEAFLRASADVASDQLKVLNLVRFLADHRGPEAAVAELDARIAEGNSPVIFRATRAGLLFDQGNQEAAIAEMQSVIETAEPSDEVQQIRVGLARMLMTVGNPVGARSLVEEVLKEDPSDLEANKLKANWLILNDQVADAITILRQAIDDHPREADLMTLMAQAHERDGNRELMRDMLALAVEASGRAPDETLRYAQLMASDGEFLTAEAALIDALRLAPGTPELLIPLAQIYIAIKDWPRAEAVALEIEGLRNPDLADPVANLRAAIFAGQQSTDQAVGYLQGLVDSGNAGINTKIAIIRTHIEDGDMEAARAYASKLVSEDPKNPSLRFIEASVQSVMGEMAPAEKTFRDLVTEDPARTQVWMALYRAVVSDPARDDEAGKVLDDAIAANPDVGELQWAKAGYFERRGEIPEAIKVYESLYAQNSANMIVANNLASLISSYRDDDESLARAELIARRLRGSNVPAYQDTYGWIAYRLGRYPEAERELSAAVEALPEDPMVRYHLAMTQIALNKKAEAAATLAQVLALTVETDKRDFVESARAEASKLDAEGFTANN